MRYRVGDEIIKNLSTTEIRRDGAEDHVIVDGEISQPQMLSEGNTLNVTVMRHKRMTTRFHIGYIDVEAGYVEIKSDVIRTADLPD